MTTARAEGGFTLFEVIVVMALVAAIMGVVMTTLVGAERRFKRAARAAEARSEVARAAERMVGDIRSARGAREERGALVLTMPDGGGVKWWLCEGRLTRSPVRPGGRGAGDEDEFASRADLSGLRVKVEEVEEGAGRSPFVEVGIEIEAPRPLGRTTGPRPRGPVLYVGARPRAGGAM